MPDTQIAFNTSIWEEGQHIVTMRPKTAPEWKGVPLGMAMSKEEAHRTAVWLRGAFPELRQMILNMEKIDEIERRKQYEIDKEREMQEYKQSQRERYE